MLVRLYRVFNKSTLTIENSMHVKFKDSNSLVKNTVEIESLGEDFENIFTNTHRLKRRMTRKKMTQMTKLKM